KFHEEAEAKILSHLKTKDPLLAKAVKAIIYGKIKESQPEATGLDKAAKLLKEITTDNIDNALKQKDLIKEITDHLKQKAKDREERMKSGKTRDDRNKGKTGSTDSVDSDIEIGRA